MVTHRSAARAPKAGLAAFLAGMIVLAAGCDNDIPGLVGSRDLDERLASRNTFNFLSQSELNLNLSPGEEYSFLVLTDPHISDKNAHGLENLKDIISRDDKFVVITGDISQNGEAADIERFIDIARTLRAQGIPCYPVNGNHDVYFGSWPNWKKLIGSTSYRVNAGDTSLFMLDSANAFFGDSQLDWLENELRNAPDRVFVFSHANLFVEGPLDIQQFTDTHERARFMFLLKGRSGAMFMGHVHKRIERKAGGFPYITIEDFRNNKTYCRVRVKADGVSWEFLKLF